MTGTCCTTRPATIRKGRLHVGRHTRLVELRSLPGVGAGHRGIQDECGEEGAGGRGVIAVGLVQGQAGGEPAGLFEGLRDRWQTGRFVPGDDGVCGDDARRLVDAGAWPFGEEDRASADSSGAAHQRLGARGRIRVEPTGAVVLRLEHHDVPTPGVVELQGRSVAAPPPGRGYRDVMTRRGLAAMALLVLAATTACTTAGPSTPGGSGAGGSGAETSRAQTSGARMPPFQTRAVAAFDEPWAMVFLPDGQALVTQRGGALLLVDPKTGAATAVTGTPQVVHDGQGGLGDVVLAPTHASDSGIYLSWVEAGAGGTGAVVGRATLRRDGTPRLDDLAVIWRQEPKTNGSGHFGHRIAVSPDGQHLFVTSGERQKFDPAQDLGGNLGKIVRLQLDGSAAQGNPFADRGGVTAQVWSLGHRNPLGIALDEAGNLWSSEMGPQGGDEVNLVQAGGNYGWPQASNGSHYGGADIPDHRAGDGFAAPAVWWTPSISPGSLMIYRGNAFPAWRGDAFVGALSGQALIRIDLDGTSASKGDQWPMGARIREVEQGPDGSIWLLEDGPGGRLLQLTPA